MKSLADPEQVTTLRERVATITAQDTRRWGSMSVEEMLSHVGAAYRLGSGDAPLAPVRIPIPRALMKFGALRLPLRWPHGVPTLPELSRERLQPVRDIESGRQSLLAALNGFVAERENRRVHPIFGPMQPGDWMRWGYLHADHHLRQFGR